MLEIGENLGFGPAINRAVRERPADPVILLNNDIECEPGLIEAMLDAQADGAESVAGVLLQERDPGRIDSAGVVADATLMGFDYLHGEPVASAAAAPDPLGPTGGAALYSRAAFEAVGGFDERIFLYYEDLDLALRMAAAGGRCRLAPRRRAIHAYSASLGAGAAEKYARTGWSRGYMLRRYGVMSSPRRALRALACEAALCAASCLLDRTGRGGRRPHRGLAGRRRPRAPRRRRRPPARGHAAARLPPAQASPSRLRTSRSDLATARDQQLGVRANRRRQKPARSLRTPPIASSGRVQTG